MVAALVSHWLGAANWKRVLFFETRLKSACKVAKVARKRAGGANGTVAIPSITSGYPTLQNVEVCKYYWYWYTSKDGAGEVNVPAVTV